MLIAAAAPALGEDLPEVKSVRVIDIGLGAALPYKDDFGGAGVAPSALVSYLYRVGKRAALGVTLLRFNWHPSIEPTVLSFAYGFQVMHWIDFGEPKEPRIITPYVSYGLLLSQVFRPGMDGNEVGHNSRIALGADYRLSPVYRLFTEVVWDYVSYPGFNQNPIGMQTISGFVGLRMIR